LEEILDLRLIGDVHRHEDAVELLGDARTVDLVEIADDHLRALGDELPRGREADPAASAGDDADLAVELSHLFSLLPLVAADQLSVEMKTFFTSEKESGASGPSSRPSPDCLNPPKGVQ